MTEANGVTGNGQHHDTGGSRSARLDRILSELVGQVPEIEAAAVVSFDGLPMASALPLGMDEDRVAAMSAALLSLGERAAEGLGRGELSQVYVEGENGTVFLVSADDEAVLVAVAAKGAKTGLMLFEVRQAATALAEVLRVEAPWDQPSWDEQTWDEAPAEELAPVAVAPLPSSRPVGYDIDQPAPLHVVTESWSSEVHGSLAPNGNVLPNQSHDAPGWS
jgi:predicted regulator of Ras-like GTPase activity (Roadblock/LC7/MglB family)